MNKRQHYLFEGTQGKHYVKAWKEKREIVVQVWLNKETEKGEPDGDWVMPSILGLVTCINQAILQTKRDIKEK